MLADLARDDAGDGDAAPTALLVAVAAAAFAVAAGCDDGDVGDDGGFQGALGDL